MSKSKGLEDRLADIADEAEAGEEDQTIRPIPAHVRVTRGNPRSKVLQVRLNPEEYAAIERIAERCGLPPSTVAREQLLELVADEDAQDRPLVALVAAADRIKALAGGFEARYRAREEGEIASFPAAAIAPAKNVPAKAPTKKVAAKKAKRSSRKSTNPIWGTRRRGGN